MDFKKGPKSTGFASKKLQKRADIIGDVRGKRLFVGCDFVKDRSTKKPGPETLKEIQKRCFRKGVILWEGERWNNVAKFMSALVISESLLGDEVGVFEKTPVELEEE